MGYLNTSWALRSEPPPPYLLVKQRRETMRAQKWPHCSHVTPPSLAIAGEKRRFVFKMCRPIELCWIRSRVYSQHMVPGSLCFEHVNDWVFQFGSPNPTHVESPRNTFSAKAQGIAAEQLCTFWSATDSSVQLKTQNPHKIERNL